MKVYTYLIITIGLTLLLHFAGVNNTDNAVIRIMGVGFETNSSLPEYGSVTSANVSASSFYNTLFSSGDITGLLIALAGTAGALIVGLYAKGFSMETAIVIPFITGTMILFVETFVNLFAYGIGTGDTFVSAITALIFIPLTGGYIFSLIEFIRGTD